jgi:hypothetical protein
MTLRYINECLPQPYGLNVPLRYNADGRPDPNCPYVKYCTDNSRRAADLIREREEQGYKDEIELGDLIHINVHAVWARYCEVPMAQSFFNKVKSSPKAPPVCFEHPDWSKAPEKVGWAIEVRGYTYHNDGLRFVMTTFMDKLRTGVQRQYDADKKQWIHEKGVVVPQNDPAGRWHKLDISHIAVLCYHTDIITAQNNPEFQYIKAPLFLNELVKAGSGGAGGLGGGSAGYPGAPAGAGAGIGGPGMGSPDGAGGAGGAGGGKARSDWTGLGSSGGGSGGGLGGIGGAGAGGGMGVPSLPGLGGGGGGLGGNTGGGDSYVKPLKAGERKRTEFVIVLYWHEPLPTEPDPKGGFEEANQDFGGYPGAPGGGYPGYPSGGGDAGPTGSPDGDGGFKGARGGLDDLLNN